MRQGLSAAALVLCLAAAGPAGADGITFFTIGAGPLGGGYYAAARAICDEIHARYPGKMRCSPDPTPGSVYNVQALIEGQLDFALVQSDTHKYAVTGTGPFAGAGPNTGLRSVLSLYAEPLTVVARRDAGIDRVQDLAGKRVNLGPRNSGTRATVMRLLEAIDADESVFGEARSLTTGAAIDQLCQGSLDAAMIVVGHPNPSVARALADCDSTLIPVTGPAIDAHVAESPDFTPTVIAAGTYPELTRGIQTFSVTATLMTRADVPANTVTAVASTIAETLPDLHRRAPVIPANRTPGLASDGLSAPLYDGLGPILTQ